MKTWQSFGSAHSARLTIIGEFKSVENAELMQEAVEDFVNAAWEERYANVQEFLDAWKDRIQAVEYYGPHNDDFHIGGDDSCAVTRQGSTVKVTHVRGYNIGGIIKLMLLGFPGEVKITGRTGP